MKWFLADYIKTGIGFRAEMDALKMAERTDLVDYHTVTKYAHMCGHDGHTVTLIGFLITVWNNTRLFSKVKFSNKDHKTIYKRIRITF